MNELIVFYGALLALVVGGVVYSLRLYHKHENEPGRHRLPHG